MQFYNKSIEIRSSKLEVCHAYDCFLIIEMSGMLIAKNIKSKFTIAERNKKRNRKAPFTADQIIFMQYHRQDNSLVGITLKRIL